MLENGDCFNARYLLNPATRVFVPVIDMADDDFVSEPELQFWERRLGVVIGRPEIH